ncbi:MAG: DUF3726 domain-containing protein [Rhodobacteraceae bacterium]|nr:DUF3726 domain-containing protein [Paracoccaceae bacterium]
MSFSLNEVEAMARKAARGAGCNWGLAEEAGRAARWLCAQGLDGVQLLSEALSSQELAGVCPLKVGASVADRAATLPCAPHKLAHVAYPVLLLPFVAMAAQRLEQAVWVECDGAHAVTDGQGLAMTGDFPDHATRVDILVDGVLSAPMPRQTRATPDPEAWAALARLAHLTYAPATEASRLHGAGAGLSDND